MEIIKLVVTDDHEMFRYGLQRIFSTYPDISFLFGASDGKDLLDKLSKLSKKELPDIAILDINMPIMNGYDTAKKLKLLYPNIKILALTMYGEEANIIRMIKSGANGYVLKTDKPDKLYSAIKKIYSEGYYHSDLTSSVMMKEVHGDDVDIVLSDREHEFLKYCSTDMTYREIAETMELSERTIDGYRDKLFQKFDVKSRIGLVIKAVKTGIVFIQ